MDERKTGLWDKYEIRRKDGSSGAGGKHEHCTYYVLDLNHDKFAVQALKAYAEACKNEYPALSEDILKLIAKFEGISQVKKSCENCADKCTLKNQWDKSDCRKWRAREADTIAPSGQESTTKDTENTK